MFHTHKPIITGPAIVGTYAKENWPTNECNANVVVVCGVQARCEGCGALLMVPHNPGYRVVELIEIQDAA